MIFFVVISDSAPAGAGLLGGKFKNIKLFYMIPAVVCLKPIGGMPNLFLKALLKCCGEEYPKS
jgi:hypothetical protein